MINKECIKVEIEIEGTEWLWCLVYMREEKEHQDDTQRRDRKETRKKSIFDRRFQPQNRKVWREKNNRGHGGFKKING